MKIIVSQLSLGALTLFALFSSASGATPICKLVLNGEGTGVPLVHMTDARYDELRREIIQSYSNALILRPALRSMPPSSRILVREPLFELEYDTERRNEENERSHSFGPNLIDEVGILRIATISQDWLNFISFAIYKDDLANLLREIHAYKVQLFYDIPEVSFEPSEVNLIPVDNPSAKLSRNTTPIKESTPGSHNLIRGGNVNEIYRSITRHAFAGATAETFLNENLGFPIKNAIRSPYLQSEVLEMLNGLGFEQSPALAMEGYWRLTVKPELTSAVYKKVAAALEKMENLGLIYIDARFSATNADYKTGIITRAEYAATWGNISTVRAEPLGDTKKFIDGVPVYEGFAEAIKYIEEKGFIFVEGKGYVLPPN